MGEIAKGGTIRGRENGKSHREYYLQGVLSSYKDTGDFSMEKNCRNVFLRLSEKFDTFLILLLDSRLSYYSILLGNIHSLSFTLLFKVHPHPFFPPEKHLNNIYCLCKPDDKVNASVSDPTKGQAP